MKRRRRTPDKGNLRLVAASHLCKAPKITTPADVYTLDVEWRCPTCGLVWEYHIFGTYQTGKAKSRVADADWMRDAWKRTEVTES